MKLYHLVGAAALLVAAPAYSLTEEPRDSVATDSSIVALVKLIGLQQKVKDTASVDSTPIELNILNYLSEVYEESDYYSAGSTAGNQIKSRSVPLIYSGPLPEYLQQEFISPVKGRINSTFGIRPESGKLHKGIDLSLRMGDSISVALSGKVERVGYERNGYGHFIVVAHQEGIQTRYAHLQRPLVKRGQQVFVGDKIALGGMSGNSSGPHLHFEIRLNGSLVDPSFLIARQPR